MTDMQNKKTSTIQEMLKIQKKLEHGFAFKSLKHQEILRMDFYFSPLSLSTYTTDLIHPYENKPNY